MDFGLVAALSDWLDPGWWWSVAQVVLGLGAVIFVHELGHFLAAKACGVKVEKFYVGFDVKDIKIGDLVLVPRRLIHFQWGETEYGVGILPLGGYVKMLGQDDNPGKMAEERQRAMTEPGEGVEGIEEDPQARLDPRSYMAKSVPQRMLIISAGVIMNLIFAVIFATLAFRFGVNYEPPVVGSTLPGSPAWQNNLDGSSIAEINGVRTDDPDRYFTFQHLREAIIMDADNGPLELEVIRPETDSPVEEKILAAPNLIGMKGGGDLKSIGIDPMISTTLATPPTLDGQAAERADPPLQSGDRVVEIKGTLVVDGYDMKRTFSLYPDQAVPITVLRGGDGGELVEVTLPPNTARGLELVMETGPIRAIRKGSPAEQAGLRPLDRIEAVDGRPVGDPFRLQQQMLVKARGGETVKLTVRRADDQSTEPDGMSSTEIEIRPELPPFASLAHPRFGITVESLGINLLVRNRLAETPGGGSGLQAGDEISAIEIDLNDRQAAMPRFSGMSRQFDLASEPESWPGIVGVLQQLDVGTPVTVKYRRGQEIHSADLAVGQLDGLYRETRGIIPEIEQRFYQNSVTWVAMQNGFRQTVDDATRVLKFLKKLVRGELSVKHFGGPGTIAVVATSEASQGTSRLLLFLTLLSANLAIINFLPIPVLDGGHMVFLAYEGIFRRPVSERLQVALSVAGMVFLIALMVTVIGLDIWRLT